MTASLPSNTGSTGTWTTIAEWLQQCSEQHPCLSHVDPEWYPTRLVEILSGHRRFRIVRSDSNRFQSKGGYITLSHRWGDSSDMVKLTTSNLVALETGASVTKLRKTFQDAIDVASRMAISYLWIDSLCIIQSGDGGADWREESTKMAHVYSHSFCNISADWGDESNGLFFERESSFEPPCDIYMRWSIRSRESWWTAGVPNLPPGGGLCHILRPKGWSDDVMESPLNSRGWVLQERQLAPRILHFSPEGVSWECRVTTAWERAPLGFSGLQDAWSLELAMTLIKMRRLFSGPHYVPVDWPRLVREFTSCQLTDRSDRLVALAGIARVLASTVKDQYVAGLWSKDLPEALVWRTTSTQHYGSTASYFSPSFSWAAADCEVSYSAMPHGMLLDNTSAVFVKHREKPLSSIIDSMMRAKFSGQLLTDHIFGPITTPEVEVRMQGILRSCQLVPSRLVPSDWSHQAELFACPSTDAEASAVSASFEKGTALATYHDRYAERWAHFVGDGTSILYFYTIISYDTTMDHKPSDSVTATSVVAEGILLKSVDSSMGRFERVGYLQRWNDGRPRERPRESILLPLGNEHELPAWSYDETTGRHTFYIV